MLVKTFPVQWDGYLNKDQRKCFVRIPEWSRILSVTFEQDKIYAHVMCFEETNEHELPLVLVQSGRRTPDSIGAYLGSGLIGPFHWHVFHER